jgi:hypothetical protein
MVLPSLLLYPSVWMQKTYFQFVEDERGARLATPPSRSLETYEISIRVMAVAHGILQCAFAVVMTIPLLAAITFTIASRPSSTGILEQDESLFKRIQIAALATIFSLYAPVGSSLATVFDVEELSTARSTSVATPILGHACFFAICLPSLRTMSQDIRESLQQQTQREEGWFQWFADLIGWSSDSAPPTSVPSLDNQALFRWRLALPTAIFGQVQHKLSDYDQALDTASPEFVRALRTAVTVVYEAAEGGLPLPRLGLLIDCSNDSRYTQTS